MTPQEAKQRLERIWKDYTSAYDTASIEDLMAFDMATNAVGAIEQIQWERDLAIKQLHDLGYGLGEKPREEAKKSNDLIERQAAIDAVWNGMCIFYDCDVIRNLKALPSAQPDVPDTNVGDMVSRTAAIDAMCNACGYDCDKSKFVYDAPQDEQVILCPEHYALTVLQSAQSESTRTFVELVVEYPDPELCAYKEYKGKPYFSIKYIENGEGYIGYGTYSPKVLSQYLREYFIEPERKTGKWIPCSERLPEEHIGFYLVTVQKRRITALNVVGCDNTVHDIVIARWDYDRRAPQRGYHWCKEDKVIAWMPLPEPYREEE